MIYSTCLWGQSIQVRDRVAIVYPHLEENANKKLNEISSNNSAEKKLSTIGIVYVDSNTGKNYIITSKDALLYCDKADIKIRNSIDGNYTLYKNLKRISIIDDCNIGILEFPEPVFKNSIPIYTKEILDGDRVFISFYRNLTNVSAEENQFDWSFKNEYVTNNNVDNDSGLRQFKICTQTNSPFFVFIEDKSSPFNFSLSGIHFADNTENEEKISLYFNDLMEAINKSISSTETDIINVENNINKLINEINSKTGYRSIKDDISVNWILNYPHKTYEIVEQKAPYHAYVYDDYRKNPLEGFRRAISYQIWKKYNQIIINPKSVKIEKIDDYLCKATFSDEGAGNFFTTQWILEQKNWRLDFISLTVDSKNYKVEKTDDKLNNNIFEFNDRTSIHNSTFIGLNIPINTQTYEKDTDTIIPNKIIPGIHFGFENVALLKGWGGIGISFDVIPSDKDILRTISLDGLLRIPFNFNYVSFYPKLKGGLMWNIISNSYAWGLYYEAGTDFYINNDWGLGVTFKNQFIFPLVNSTGRYNIKGVSAYFTFRDF